MISDDSNRYPVEACKADYDIACEVLVNLEKLTIIDNPVNQAHDIVGFVRVFGNQAVENLVSALGIICRVKLWRVFTVVRWQVRHKFAYQRYA